VKATLNAGDRGFGLLVTAWGAGAVLGSVVFARFVRRQLGLMLSAGTFALGGAYIGFAAAPSLALACLAALVGGVGNGLQWPSLISLVQRLTPQDLHGRLMGAVESLGALSLAIGLPLGGALVALSSPRIAFLVVGVGAAVSTAAFLRLSPRLSRSTVRTDAVVMPTSAPGELNEPLQDDFADIDRLHAIEHDSAVLRSASPTPEPPPAP
jgi:MFS family permease